MLNTSRRERGHKEEIKHQTHWGHRLEMVIILNLHHLIKKSPPSPDTQIYLIPSEQLTVKGQSQGYFLKPKDYYPNAAANKQSSDYGKWAVSKGAGARLRESRLMNEPTFFLTSYFISFLNFFHIIYRVSFMFILWSYRNR